MANDDINLESLAPWQDENDFETIVQSVATRAHVRRTAQTSVTFQLRTLFKPALALAAAVTIVVWTGAFTISKSNEVKPHKHQDAAFALAAWESSGTMPSTAEILRTFGGSNEQ